MSSILTNNSAMVALDTLRGINKNLGSVQNEISTGKKVATAKDNAAIWAISTVMSTDVESFSQISDSLNLGSATVGVARSASEQVTGLLQDAKELIVSAQEENVDRTKIQTDLDELFKQVGSVVGAAQFNGQNLINSGGSINVLSSLDRASNGDVTSSSINVGRQNLSESAAVAAADALEAGDGGDVTLGGDFTDTNTGTITIGAGTVVEGTTSTVDLDGTTFEYTSVAGDTNDDIATNLGALITAGGVAGVSVTANVISVVNGSGADIVADEEGALKGGEAAGGLSGLSALDVTSNENAAAALTAIEGFLSTAIDAAAQFGSKQTRIDNQNEFVSTLKDSLKTGIGALTDSNLEEASARLQSLQVQQQLGVQALSIANQGPQQLLALFR